MNKYQQISVLKLKEHFRIEKRGTLFRLVYSTWDNPIYIKLPFILDENIASLAGLMPDASLIKDLMRIYFHQKKDVSKIYLFQKIIKDLFSPESTLFYKERKDGTRAFINSQTLAKFFYFILQIPKSDEQMRVPRWIFKSPDSVKIAYLKEAFDMEGTILKRLNEIRLVSKDKKFIYDLQRLLLSIGIGSNITFAPRLKQKTSQYRLSIYRKENFIKFKKIGFGIPNNKKRFKELMKKYEI